MNAKAVAIEPLLYRINIPYDQSKTEAEPRRKFEFLDGFFLISDPQTLLEAWAVPAEGYCRKNAPIEEIAEVIRHVYTEGK